MRRGFGEDAMVDENVGCLVCGAVVSDVCFNSRASSTYTCQYFAAGCTSSSVPCQAAHGVHRNLLADTRMSALIPLRTLPAREHYEEVVALDLGKEGASGSAHTLPPCRLNTAYMHGLTHRSIAKKSISRTLLFVSAAFLPAPSTFSLAIATIRRTQQA